ncbi:MAG: LD-carboxypeptidase [Lachnospiraceae bacterium]|nr:LD-carboxypeptidase [Lachnospiraceae bacterium]
MKVGLSACSDGQLKEWEYQNKELVEVFAQMGIEAVTAQHLYAQKEVFAGTDRERAEELMRFYRDDSVGAIYDITCGDLANGVLGYLDWDVIAHSDKLFWGYSDLSALINAIYTKTGKSSVLFNIKNLVYDRGELQRKRFADYVSGKATDLFDIKYEFLRGRSMEGVVVGGNIRCLLKLAGTEFWPDVEGKILLLESYSGGAGKIATAMNQLDLMGVFDKVAGVLLGTFTEYEKKDRDLSVFELLETHIASDLPVAHTPDIGHGTDSKAIVIGGKRKFEA